MHAIPRWMFGVLLAASLLGCEDLAQNSDATASQTSLQESDGTVSVAKTTQALPTNGTDKLPILAYPPKIKKCQAEVKYREWSWACNGGWGCWKTKKKMISIPPPVSPADISDLVVGYLQVPSGIATVNALLNHVDRMINAQGEHTTKFTKAMEELDDIKANKAKSKERYVRDVVKWIGKYNSLFSATEMDPVLREMDDLRSTFLGLDSQVKVVLNDDLSSFESDLEKKLEKRIKSVVMQGPAPIGTVWGTSAKVDLEVAIPDFTPLNDIRKRLLAMDSTLVNLGKGIANLLNPFDKLLRDLLTVSIPENNDLGQGNLTLQGLARTAWMLPEYFGLTGSIVYLEEYPGYCAKVKDDGTYTFKGLRREMKVTPTVIPIPYIANMLDFIATYKDQKDGLGTILAQFLFTDATGYLITKGETFTIDDYHIRNADIQVPSHLLFFVFKQLLGLDDQALDFKNRGIVQATLQHDGGNRNKVANGTAKLVGKNGREYFPYYYGYLSEVGDDSNDIARLVKWIAKDVAKVSEEALNSMPIPLLKKTSTTADGGVVFLNIPPGEYRLVAEDAEGELLYAEPIGTVVAGEFTNVSPRQGLYCVSEIGVAESAALANDKNRSDILAYFGFGDIDKTNEGDSSFIVYDDKTRSADDGDDADRSLVYDFSSNRHVGRMHGGSLVSPKHTERHLVQLDANDYISTNVEMVQTQGVTFEVVVSPEVTQEASEIRYLVTTGDGANDWSVFIQGGTWHVNTGRENWDTRVEVTTEPQTIRVVFGPDGARFYRNGLWCATSDAVGFDETKKTLSIGVDPDPIQPPDPSKPLRHSFVGEIDSVLVYGKALPLGNTSMDPTCTAQP